MTEGYFRKEELALKRRMLSFLPQWDNGYSSGHLMQEPRPTARDVSSVTSLAFWAGYAASITSPLSKAGKDQIAAWKETIEAHLDRFCVDKIRKHVIRGR